MLDLVDLDGDVDAQLILLGDYVDRGPDSAGVLKVIRDLQVRFPGRVTALIGNHEDWLLDWLDGDDEDLDWLMADTDLLTVKSFVPPAELARMLGNAPSTDAVMMNRSLKQAIFARHTDLIDWLRELPRLHETETQIFMHAGVDEEAGALWRSATPDYMLTEKHPATFGPFIKTVIAGHVGTAEMNADGSPGVFHDGQSHFYIDGSVEVTGKLNVLRYTTADESYEPIVVTA